MGVTVAVVFECVDGVVHCEGGTVPISGDVVQGEVQSHPCAPPPTVSRQCPDHGIVH